ncbi:MAG TPA: metallophosphoesterase [Thermoanaerobaculia bacterium]|nr:metallophosphoesterase [Thermoanaerobaculia bacterium]
MLLGMLIFLAVAALIFGPLNWVTIRFLRRIHPRRKRAVTVLAIAGNLMWPFLAMIRSFTDFARVTRATLGPVWFGWTCFTFLYAAFLLLVLLAWLPFRRRATFAQFAHTPSKSFLIVLIVGFAVGCWQALVPLRIEHVPVELANLPASLEGKKIAVLGDLHVGLYTRRSRLVKIFAAAANEHPDVVLIAGDMIDDDPHFTPKLLDGARTLPASIPLFAVYGNHEMYGDPFDVAKALRGSRIRLLVNEGVRLGDLWLAGISDPAAKSMPEERGLVPDFDKALRDKPANAFPFVFAHQPKAFDEAKRRALPITVVAHTHGGQLGFRPLRWSLAGVFLPYHMGLYQAGASQLYVNTGTGYWLFPFRLGMTPEITIIELRARK